MKTQRHYTLKLSLPIETTWSIFDLDNLAIHEYSVNILLNSILQITKKDCGFFLNIYRYTYDKDSDTYVIPEQDIWFTGTSAELDLITNNMPRPTLLAIGNILEVYLPDTVKVSNGEYPKRLTNPLKPGSTDTEKLQNLYRSFAYILTLENDRIPQLVVDRFPEAIKSNKNPTPIDKLDLIYWNESLSKMEITKNYIRALYKK